MRGFGLCRAGSVVAVAIMLLAVGDLQAEKVSVKLKDGRTVVGELVSQSDKKVTLKVSGVELSFDRDKVASVSAVAKPSDPPKPPKATTMADAFAQKRKAIADTDFAKRYALCNEYFQLGNKAGKSPKALEPYKLALGEIEQLVKVKPDSLPYKLLKDELAKRVAALDTQSPNPNTNPNAKGPAELINDDQINLLWIYETDTKKRSQQSGIRKMSMKAIQKLFEDTKYRDDPAMKPFLGSSGISRFNRLKGYQQLDLLFQMRAREYYEEIKVSEPEHFKTFATQIHSRYVVNYCASCHSKNAPKTSPEALKALTLITKRSNPSASNKQIVYTNYMTLVEQNSGPFQIIDRGAPKRSPLLEFGVNPESAQRPHPTVKGMDVFFRTGAGDKNYQSTLAWINKLYPGDYPFRLTKPTPPATKNP